MTHRRPKRGRRVLQSLGLAAVSVVLSGCSALSGPQPWQKGQLAKPEMSMGGDALELRYQSHIYTSKEAASGGYGVGGGGCGCN
jgi:hypothetical protein